MNHGQLRASSVVHRAGLVAVLATMTAVAAPLARAGGPGGGGSDADVEEFIKKGTAHRRAGRDREALAEFQHAAEVRNSPRVASQIALAEQALGMWLSAHEHLKTALAAPGDPWIQKNRPTLDGALTAIEGHLGTIEVWGTPAGAEVVVESKVVGKLPSATTAVVAGDVQIEVRIAGYAPVSRTVKVPGRGRMREYVELSPAGTKVATTTVSATTTAPPPAVVLAAHPPETTSDPLALGTQPVAEPASPSPADGGDQPVYKRWWFWTAIGVVTVAAGGTAVYLMTRDSGPSCATPPCSTWN